MTLLIASIVAFSVVHLIPAVAPALRRSLVASLGEIGFKALFSVLSLATLFGVVRGWGAAAGPVLYAPPAWGWHVTPLFVLAAFILFVASRLPTNVRRKIRHPQLAAVKFWAFGHLFSNGEWRSVVLFAGLIAWAVVAMIFINKRDGAWTKPGPFTKLQTTLSTLVGVVAYLVFMKLHLSIIGVSPFPG
jgi:Predicted membrane protein